MSVLSPKAPAPPPPPPPPAINMEDPAEKARVQKATDAAAEAERRQKSGAASTILTGPQGLLTSPSVSRRVLLGA